MRIHPVAFEFRGQRMSENTAEELWRYFNNHCPTGSFMLIRLTITTNPRGYNA